jgi:hypothetical protein
VILIPLYEVKDLYDPPVIMLRGASPLSVNIVKTSGTCSLQDSNGSDEKIIIYLNRNYFHKLVVTGIEY